MRKKQRRSIRAENFVQGFLFFIFTIGSIICLIIYLWMLRYSKNEFVNSFTEWKKAYPVGFYGAASTVCWFYAFSANAVAPVRAVGQIELIIAIFFSIFFFRERPVLKEILAILLLLISILMILLE